MCLREDLFDFRDEVGARLTGILDKRHITKARFCTEVGMSRPTLNKLLAGGIANRTTFNRHMEKVLSSLSLTAEDFMGDLPLPGMRIKSLRSALRVQLEQMSEETDIPVGRLREIERGDNADIKELRDIAYCLCTSVNGILGRGFFEAQISALSSFLSSDMDEELHASGFWGYIGVQASGTPDYLWFPITAGARGIVSRAWNRECVVVPCMNNKLLYINMKHMNSVVLLDDACDEPEFANWDVNVDCGETPQVVYESLYSYFYEINDNPNQEAFSPALLERMKAICKEKRWDADTVCKTIDRAIVRYADGKTLDTEIAFDGGETVSAHISLVYDSTDDADPERFWVLSDMNGAQMLINTDHVSLIELPLVKTEAAILRGYGEAESE